MSWQENFQKIPNEVLLQVCQCLDPLNAEDQQTLLALRRTCRAGRDFTSPFSFKLCKLRFGQENARRQIFSLYDTDTWTHLQIIELNIRSMMPEYMLDGRDEPPEEKQKDARNRSESASDWTQRMRAARYASDFYGLLVMLLRVSDRYRRLQELRLDSTCYDIFKKDEIGREETIDCWSEAFWQCVRCAMKNFRDDSSLPRLDVRVTNLREARYLYFYPVRDTIEENIMSHYRWGEEDDPDLISSFSNLISLKITVVEANECKEGKLLGETNSERIEKHNDVVESLARQYLPGLPYLEELDWDFGRANAFYSTTTITPMLEYYHTYHGDRLTKLRLHWFVEGAFQRDLFVLLQACENLEQLHLHHCAIATAYPPNADKDGGEPIDSGGGLTWEDIFEVCREEREQLVDIYFEGLDYFQLMTFDRDVSKLKPLPGWTCGMPLHSPRAKDYKAFCELVVRMIIRRKFFSKNLPQDIWLEKFCADHIWRPENLGAKIVTYNDGSAVWKSADWEPPYESSDEDDDNNDNDEDDDEDEDDDDDDELDEGIDEGQLVLRLRLAMEKLEASGETVAEYLARKDAENAEKARLKEHLLDEKAMS